MFIVLEIYFIYNEIVGQWKQVYAPSHVIVAVNDTFKLHEQLTFLQTSVGLLIYNM